MPTNLTAALAYVTGDSPLGEPVRIIAINPRSKKPLHKWRDDSAASTEAEVRALFDEFPEGFSRPGGGA